MGKKLPWFRAYTEMVDDEKLRLLAFEDRWHFVALLCLKGQGVLDESDALLFRKVAVKLGVDMRTLEEVARRLAEVGLIDEKTLQPLAWENRQYKSDSSAERTRAYRERMKRHRDVTVTVQDTDTDTDKEVNTLSGKPDAEPADLMQAKEAIDYLNEKTNSGFQKVETNLRMVRARLAEGFSLDVVKAVIDRQVDRWGSDPKMSEYLRPKTLFAASNFASYAGQITAKHSDWWTQAGFDSAFDAENHGCNANTAYQWRNRQRVEVPA